MLSAGGRVPPGLQGVPRSGAQGGCGELGCQGWAAGRWQLLFLLYRLEPPQQLPWGDLARPSHRLMAGAGAGGCWSGEGPGPWSLGREGTAETGGLGQGHGGGGREQAQSRELKPVTGAAIRRVVFCNPMITISTPLWKVCHMPNTYI